jgi:hypothetical protein
VQTCDYAAVIISQPVFQASLSFLNDACKLINKMGTNLPHFVGGVCLGNTSSADSDMIPMHFYRSHCLCHIL